MGYSYDRVISTKTNVKIILDVFLDLNINYRGTFVSITIFYPIILFKRKLRPVTKDGD